MSSWLRFTVFGTGNSGITDTTGCKSRLFSRRWFNRPRNSLTLRFRLFMLSGISANARRLGLWASKFRFRYLASLGIATPCDNIRTLCAVGGG
jgi:hypothetical protein